MATPGLLLFGNHMIENILLMSQSDDVVRKFSKFANYVIFKKQTYGFWERQQPVLEQTDSDRRGRSDRNILRVAALRSKSGNPAIVKASQPADR